MWSFKAAHEVHMLTMLFMAFLLPRCHFGRPSGGDIFPWRHGSASSHRIKEPFPFPTRGRDPGPRRRAEVPTIDQRYAGAIGVASKSRARGARRARKDGPGSASPGFARQARGLRRCISSAPGFAIAGFAARHRGPDGLIREACGPRRDLG